MRLSVCISAAAAAPCCSSISSNLQMGGFLPSEWSTREFKMEFPTDYSLSLGKPIFPQQPEGSGPQPYNYGAGGRTLYTTYGPIWRTKITNWAGLSNNAGTAPDDAKLPNPDPCVENPFNNICV
jgi:hypothetical protein